MSNKTYKIAEDIFFSAAIFRLSKGERDIKLSNKEAELLEMLCDEAGSVIPRNIMQEALWPNQDNTDTNLNRQILSLRRKLESFGLLDGIDTIPRVGYIFCAPVEVTGEGDNTGETIESMATLPQARQQYTRRKYDRYLHPKRIVQLIFLIVVFSSLAMFFYHYSNENTLRAIKISHISLYTTNEVENALKFNIDKLTPLVKRVPNNEDEHVSILIGKEAISYFSIDNKDKKLSENVFLLRTGHPVTEELQCVIATMSLQGENVSNNYYNSPNTTVRYHSSCQAPDNWVEITRKSKMIVTMNKEIAVSTVIATDHRGNSLFNLDSVGNIERDEDDFALEITNTIVNLVDQKALISNGMVAPLVAAMTPPKQKLIFIQLPGGIYLSSYMGGVIFWPSRDNLKVIPHNDR